MVEIKECICDRCGGEWFIRRYTIQGVTYSYYSDCGCPPESLNFTEREVS